VDAAAEHYTITFDDSGVATLDVLEVTDDFVFVDDGAFCKCCHLFISCDGFGLTTL